MKKLGDSLISEMNAVVNEMGEYSLTHPEYETGKDFKNVSSIER